MIRFACKNEGHYVAGGKWPSNKRFSRSMIRDGSLMFKTWTVTLPENVLPMRSVCSQRKCRLQFCFRGLNSG